MQLNLCRAVVQIDDHVQPSAATLVSLAAMGADNTRFVIQLPAGGHAALHEHHRDSLQSAAQLHLDGDGSHRVVQVDALQALSEAKVQCALAPGTLTASLLLAG